MYAVIFYVYDQKGGSDIDTVSIQVIDNAPQVADIPDTSFLVSDTLELDLNLFVSDCDDRLETLQWNVTGNAHLAVDIGSNHVAGIFSPEGWTGTELLTFIVRDPHEQSSFEECLITVARCPGGTLGDVDGNGDINVLDMLKVCNHIVGTQMLDSDGQCRADCNGDGNINVLDAVGIANVILGIFPSCPGGTAR